MRASLASRPGLLTCAYYAALFLAIGAHLPYWPVWLADWGLSEVEIGSYMGAALLVRLLSNAALSAVADTFGVRRLMLGLAGAAAAIVFLLHAFVETRPALLALTLLVTLTLSPMIPLGEALGLRAALRHGFAYARARAVGSIAFLAMNVGLGIAIRQVGADAALWSLVGCCAAASVLGLVHPGGGAPPGGGVDTAGLREGWRLMASPAFRAFLVAASFGQASHAVLYSFGSLAWMKQGIGADMIGLLWAAGVLAETWLMLGPGGRFVSRIGPSIALALAGLAGTIRWGVMTFEPASSWLWPLQALHAGTFALAHLGAMAFIAAAVPPRLAASVQGVYVGTLTGFAMAGTTALAGWVGEAAGTASAYWLAAGLSTAALVAGLMLRRHWRGEALAV